MEVVSPQLRRFMDEQSQEVDSDWARQTRNTGGLMVMDIGPRGGGKTTKAVELVQYYKEVEPEVRRVANVPIEGAYYVPNILKFLATKLIAEGGEKPYRIASDGTVEIVPRKLRPAKMLTIVDETAISGLESRGSGSSGLNTYLLALSRKLNVDCELITQLMSMSDKRSQWLSDFYTLCEAYLNMGFFQYRNYDSEYHKTTTQRIYFDFARKMLFPKFDTTDIPNYDELSTAFKISYQISDDDMSLYEDIKAGRKHVMGESVIEQKEEEFLSRKALRAPAGRFPGETILKIPEDNDGYRIPGAKPKRYEVLQRDWDFDESQYRYRVAEIPDYAKQQAAINEGGLEAIEEEFS